MTRQEAYELVAQHVAQLAEHFDSVQVLASRMNEKNETEACIDGSGNWYARQGLAQEFIGLSRAEEIANRINDP